MVTFQAELEALINRRNKENDSNTPDFILATYLSQCLAAFNEAVKARAIWYGRMDEPAALKKEMVRTEPFDDHSELY